MLDKDVAAYRRCNPWIIQNLQNSQAHCGRFPTKDLAIAQAITYRGGVVQVDDEHKIIYVSEVPSL